jgi:hypothetical protein
MPRRGRRQHLPECQGALAGAARRISHSIVSPNVRDGGRAALVEIPTIAFPGIHGYRMPVTVGATARSCTCSRT